MTLTGRATKVFVFTKTLFRYPHSFSVKPAGGGGKTSGKTVHRTYPSLWGRAGGKTSGKTVHRTVLSPAINNSGLPKLLHQLRQAEGAAALAGRVSAQGIGRKSTLWICLWEIPQAPLAGAEELERKARFFAKQKMRPSH
jgi:hypothetical protein